MRTTVTLESDVAAAIEKIRRERGLGLSEAVNELVRRGLKPGARRRRFKQRSQPLGSLIDLTNIGQALEKLEGPLHK